MLPAAEDFGANQLENLIDVATDPARYEADLGLCLEICDLVNQKGGRWPREAAVAIVRRVNSPHQQQAILALTLLDFCVKNCGYPFHLQISTKEFLNELVRRFPANPPSAVNPIQWKILESIQQWNATLVEHSRYRSDLRHINDMYKLLSFKGYRFPGLNAEAAAVLTESQVLKTEQEMEEEDRKAQEAKLHELIRRGTPADLAQANDLMKTLTGYDMDRRPDYRKKVDEELDRVSAKASDLIERLSLAKPGARMDATVQELFVACKSAASRVQKMITEAEENDSRLNKLLELNDLLNTALESYDAIKNGRTSSALPSATAGRVVSPSTASRREPTLIDFDAGDNGDMSSATSQVTPPASPSKQSTSLIEDLAGLNFSDSSRPWGLGGGVALAAGSAKPSDLDLFDQTNSLLASSGEGPAPAFSALAGRDGSDNRNVRPAPDPAKVARHLAAAGSPEGLIFDKNGLKILAAKAGESGSTADYVLQFYNAIPVPMERLAFQAAVPKAMSLKLDPASDSTIPGNNKEPLTQRLTLVNQTTDVPRLRFRVAYEIAGTLITEEGESAL
ncbi:VHS domain-containing protein [Hyaloraphidium curvatum]|nr:VHS domain-containing protein [Hyaloraphidium curvatum]